MKPKWFLIRQHLCGVWHNPLLENHETKPWLKPFVGIYGGIESFPGFLRGGEMDFATTHSIGVTLKLSRRLSVAIGDSCPPTFQARRNGQDQVPMAIKTIIFQSKSLGESSALATTSYALRRVFSANTLLSIDMEPD